MVFHLNMKKSFVYMLFLHWLIPPDSKSRTSGRLSHGIPQVPQKRGPSELDCFRRALPVYDRQDEIIQTIRENQVVLVLGETGSGKTTQVRTV